MFAAIREHLAASAPHDAVRAEHHAAAAHGKDGSARDEKSAAVVFEGTAVERFLQALEAVAGHCLVVRGEAAAADALRRIILERGARRIAVSDSPLARRVTGIAEALAAANTGGETELIEDAGAAELFNCDLGVTGAQWGVAETGTLILESDAERHRLASLVPTAHVAIIEAWNVRQTLGEVLQAISDRGEGRLSRAITFITGPSRTSDIELTLAIGVHGPAELYVVVIEDIGNG
ncbi:MAG: L-lactate dehydrogenase complex protein LldG [Acidobacteriota bacterium]|nr:L-lactate dehydrogenase complex protein LldG [Acidobacteriota bacterium]